MDGILDSLEDAVIVLNAKRQVVFCNQPAEALLGKWVDSAFAETSEPLQAPDHPWRRSSSSSSRTGSSGGTRR